MIQYWEGGGSRNVFLLTPQVAQALDVNYFRHSAICIHCSVECQISVDSTILSKCMEIWDLS